MFKWFKRRSLQKELDRLLKEVEECYNASPFDLLKSFRLEKRIKQIREEIKKNE